MASNPTLIVAIIGAIALIVSGVLSNVFALFNKPLISTDIHRETESGNVTTFTWTNTGSVSATNMLVTIESSEDIISVQRELSTVKVEALNFSGKIVELQIPKFIDGPGSVVVIETTANSSNANDYTVYATYDQGSAIQSTKPEFRWNTNSFNFLFLTMTFVTIVYTVLVFVLYSTNIRRRFVASLIAQLMNLRDKLTDNLGSTETIADFWSDIPAHRRRLITKIEDQMSFEDLSRVLKKRNELAGSRDVDRERLRQKNEELLKLTNQTLRKVDWSEYRKTRLAFPFPIFSAPEPIKRHQDHNTNK